jgi:hypothetical protein
MDVGAALSRPRWARATIAPAEASIAARALAA